MRNFKKGYIISYYTVYYIYIFKTENTHSLLTKCELCTDTELAKSESTSISFMGSSFFVF